MHFFLDVIGYSVSDDLDLGLTYLILLTDISEDEFHMSLGGDRRRKSLISNFFVDFLLAKGDRVQDRLHF